MHKKCRRAIMNEQAAAARRAYKRKWARENRDKIREYQDRYWTRKAAEAAAADQRDEPAADATQTAKE